MSFVTSPIIGITIYGRNQAGEFYLPSAYVEAVRRAGGVPILLPPGEKNLEEVLNIIDGLILAGGGDIHPEFFKGAWHPTMYSIDQERDIFELAIADRVINAKLPLLGVCRGLQVIGVAGGADLVVHVPDVYGDKTCHRLEDPSRCTRHTVEIVQDSLLAQILGTNSTTITSWHHQALGSSPPGWRVVARSADGVIEAIEHNQHSWAIAVQWHPEMTAHEEPMQMALFDGLIAAATQLRNNKVMGMSKN